MSTDNVMCFSFLSDWIPHHTEYSMHVLFVHYDFVQLKIDMPKTNMLTQSTYKQIQRESEKETKKALTLWNDTDFCVFVRCAFKIGHKGNIKQKHILEDTNITVIAMSCILSCPFFLLSFSCLYLIVLEQFLEGPQPSSTDTADEMALFHLFHCFKCQSNSWLEATDYGK